MNARQLEAFRAAMRAGSISGAARLLNISQPSVSRLIGDLERSVGFQLFARNGRGIIATIEARRLNSAVESMFIGIDRLKEVAASIRETTAGEVTLGIIPALTYRVMPEAVARVHAMRPDLRIEVRVRNTPALIEAVSLQQIDLAVISPRRLPEQLFVIHEMMLRHVCIVPEYHPEARNSEPLDLTSIAPNEFVMYDAVNRSLVGGPLADAEFAGFNPTLTSPSTPAVAALARATGKLAVVDPYSAAAAVALGGIVIRRVKQKVATPLVIIARGPDTLSLTARELANELIAELATKLRSIASPNK